MKRILLLTLIAAILVPACKKPDVLADYKKFGTGAYLNLVKSENTFLNAAALAASTLSVQVRPVGSPLEKINVYAVPGGTGNLNRASWKLVKAFPVSSGDVDLKITGQELATGLGVALSAIQPGSQYTFYNETVTKDGGVYNILNTEEDLVGQPAFNSLFLWTATVVCPFNNDVSGDFTITTDEWDGNTGAIVKVLAGPAANQITLVQPFALAGNSKNVVVAINAATGAATVANQIYGDYAGFPDLAVKNVGASFVFSCTQTIDLMLNHTSPAGNFGNYRLILKR